MQFQSSKTLDYFRFNQIYTPKNALYRNYLLNREPAMRDKYLKYKNKLTHLIRTAGKNFYFNKFISAKDNINKTWHITKAITNPESHKKPTLNEIIVNNTHITDKTYNKTYNGH